MSTTPRNQNNHSKVTRRFVFGFAALMATLFVAAVVALVSIAHRQNTLMSEHSKVEVAYSVKADTRLIDTAMRDYAFWNEAYRRVGRKKVDVVWAYEQDNIGPSLYADYSIDGVFIVSPNLETRYAVVDGKLSQVSAASYLTADLEQLTQLARKRAVDDESVYGYYLVSGRPAAVYAAVVKPEETDASALSHMPVMLFVDVLNVPELGKDVGMQDLRIDPYVDQPSAEPYLNLQSDVGMRFRLKWTPEKPGDAFLHTLLPLLGALAALFALLLWVMERGMMRAARDFDASQQSLKKSENRFRSITESASDWVWETDSEGRLSFLSGRFETLTGFSATDWLGRSLCELLNLGFDSFQRLAAIESAVAGHRQQAECSYRDVQGDRRYCWLSVRSVHEEGVLVGYRGTVNDVTREVEAKRRIQHMSEHDALTGLANRSYLHAYLQNRLAGRTEPMYVLSLDLDRFKPINDTLGHATGDLVLCEVATRLRSCLRDGDLVARLGGDEFVLVVEHLPAGYDIQKLCARVCESIAQPMRHGEHDLTVGVSIGVVVAPDDGHHLSDLLRYADIALYEAKGAGRGTWQLYATEMGKRVEQRRQIETDLRNALRQNELFLEFQPRFVVNGTSLSGAEALVRWNHPTRGRLMPDQFIAIAEETGIILELSDWVLRTACYEALSWDSGLCVSVNLSPVEFQRGDLVSRVRTVLHVTGLDPARLELEITETVLLEDSAAALVIMNQLKGLGVRLSMDDFGTGYSSLSYLRTYPFDGLKIDRSFIADLQGETQGAGIAIIESIIGLGKALTMTVTAEGVETDTQLRDLARVNCDEVQGYLLGRPLSRESFQALALKHTRLTEQ
ncbi:bifunctional diguanylate cyclase/phosphodiesterase [Pseudomonas japonica]|uniref:bifunctional diguanylate cyclase/phosphodiesterase n=1 Tax=Pseudomonas japonica TaxID=256466 RepID=UPI0015E398AB|nr:EAL domain-containing protein [Pseudomonas japonica]MBA1290568.1 EAL domain-containing protein [Pseudomonas japonica]